MDQDFERTGGTTFPQRDRTGIQPPEAAGPQPARKDKGLVSGLLGVRPDEIERVRALFGVSMLLGMGLVLFYGSANAIFLTRYDISVLPWVYIANALAVIVVGLGYGAWSARVPVAKALVALSLAMSVSVAGLWLWAQLSDARVVAFLMAMWFRLLFIFAVLGLWEIASAVFDIRQAKRLFPAVALGMMVAFVIGGVATPVISPFVGAVNLVGVSAVFLAMYTVVFQRLLRKFNVGSGHDAAVAPAGPAEILSDRFSRRMVWMKTVTILLMYLTEYVFYEQSAKTFDSEASLAGFLGIFMGVMTIVMVLVTGLISGRFISRFGIRTATMTLPAGMLLIALPAGLYGSFAGIDNVFFGLVCVALATNHVLGNAVAEPASAVLFQPMPKLNRMRVRLAVHGWLGSLALLIAGVLLLVLHAMHLKNVAPLLYLVAGVGLVGIVVAVAQYSDYLHALRVATTLAFSGADRTRSAAGFLDAGFLGEGLGTDDPGSALATAFVARSMVDDPLRALLPVLSAGEDRDLIGLALNSKLHHTDPAYGALALSVLMDASLPATVRADALEVLADLEPERDTDRIQSILAGPTPEVGIRSALNNAALRPPAITHLTALTASTDPQQRVRACEVIGSVGRRSGEGANGGGAGTTDHVRPLLLQLLADADPVVAVAALDASAGWDSPEVVRAVAGHLGVPDRRGYAIRALASTTRHLADSSAILGQEVDVLPPEARAEIIKQVIGPRLDASQVLDRYLGIGTPSAVRRAGYEVLATTAAKTPVREQVVVDLDFLGELSGMWRDLGDDPKSIVARSALAEEFELARRCIYSALLVDHDPVRVRDITTLALSGDDDDRANAIEALEGLLTPDLRKRVVDALEPLDIAEASNSLASSGATRSRSEVLGILAGDSRMGTWTHRVAGHTNDLATLDGGPAMNPTIERVLSLRRVDIFSTLSYETLTELSELVHEYSAPKGKVILESGSIGQELYALVAGSVEVRSPTGRVWRLDEGTVFGELAILDPAPRSATITALTDCDLIVVPRTAILALADRRPMVMSEIARVLARRLRSDTESNP